MSDASIVSAPLKLAPGTKFEGPGGQPWIVNPDGSFALVGSKDDKTPPEHGFISFHKHDKLLINGVEVVFQTAVRVKVPYGFKRLVKVPGPNGTAVLEDDIQKTGLDNPDGSNFIVAKPEEKKSA